MRLKQTVFCREISVLQKVVFIIKIFNVFPATKKIHQIFMKKASKLPKYYFSSKLNLTLRFYTLSSAKCNGIIYFVLFVKTKEDMHFEQAPTKNKLFSMQIVFFTFY